MVEQLVIESILSYGAGGVVGLLLSWAIVSLYKSHRDERRDWMHAMEEHFNRLVAQMQTNHDAMTDLATLIRDFLVSHSHERIRGEDVVEIIRRYLERDRHAG